jgi:predicted AAA+ superfamily ATPase
MVQRHFWIQAIEKAWREKPVVWLSGVRRVGKTFLTRSLDTIEYFDCELPRIRRQMEDPEAFLHQLRGKRIVLDEIHRLSDPSELLKIAADHFTDIRVLATGSSTLGASARFKDTLAGRKRNLWLTPMNTHDLMDFKNMDLGHRFVRGGLPPFFMAAEVPDRDFQEWMDAYWAKDIQELFRLERRVSFQRFVELLLAQSGVMFEATSFARSCEVSRTTISNYLGVLEATFVAHVIRPFSTRRATEIVAAPKVYGFDTGFVCYYRGWHSLRREDMGHLWEHFVLNEMQGAFQPARIQYWRDKRGHEIDFIYSGRKRAPVVIECKWSSGEFDPKNLLAFRYHYRTGLNFVVANDVSHGYERDYGGIRVQFVDLPNLLQSLQRRA